MRPDVKIHRAMSNGWDPDFGITLYLDAQAEDGQAYTINMDFDGYSTPDQAVFERELKSPALKDKQGEDLTRGLYARFGQHLSSIHRHVFPAGGGYGAEYDTPGGEPTSVYFTNGTIKSAYSANPGAPGLRPLGEDEIAALQSRMGVAGSEPLFARTPVSEIRTLCAAANDVFGEKQAALSWLRSPCMALGGTKPAQHAQTAEGLQQVRDVLGRIEYGVYS